MGAINNHKTRAMSPFTGRNNEIVMLKKRRQFTEKGGMSLANRKEHTQKQ